MNWKSNLLAGHRAKNIVFVFYNDPIPTNQEVNALADDPSREIEIYQINTLDNLNEIVTHSPTAWEHFVTISCPDSVIADLQPIVVGEKVTILRGSHE